MRKYITKEIYLNALRCHLSSYLAYKHPELKEEKEDLLLRENAYQFERLACNLIAPGGVDINSLAKGNIKRAEETQRQLTSETRTLYQGTFITTAGDLAMTDILINAQYRSAIYEIKSYTGPLMAETIYDVAYQYYVLTEAGHKIDETHVVYVNKNYVRSGNITEDILIIEDVTAEVKRIQPQVQSLLKDIRRLLKQTSGPTSDIGNYCVAPHPCAFKNYCWKGFPTNNIFELRGMKIGTKLKLYAQDIIEYKDIPPQTKLGDKQWIQITCALENKIIAQPVKIKNWLDKLKIHEGLYFMDFETHSSPVPQFNGGKPYEQVPFQFSLHYRKGLNKQLMQHEFLADSQSKEDQQLKFVESLLEHLTINKVARILTWNAPFEKAVLKRLADRYPKYQAEIQQVISRVDDLMVVFRDWYSDARFKGSFSIKQVLPVVCPDLNYDTMKISDGSSAAYHFGSLLKLSPNQAKEVRQSLLEYCCLDTYALVRILDFLLVEFTLVQTI